MIVPVKKTSLIIFKEDKRKTLRTLQKYGLMMIDNVEKQQKIDTSYEDNLYQRTSKAINYLKDFKQKSKAFGYQEVTYEDFLTSYDSRIQLLEEVEAIDLKLSSLKVENEKIAQDLIVLEPFRDLSIETKAASMTNYSKIKYGFIIESKLEELKNYFENNNLIYEILKAGEAGIAISYAYLLEDEIKTNEDLASIGLKETELPLSDLKFKDFLISKVEENVSNLKEESELKERLYTLANQVGELRILADQMLTIKEEKLVTFEETSQSIILTGWVRTDQTEDFKKALTKANVDYEVEFRDPLETETPPTAYKNNKFVQPFETITNMFSPPDARELDPNPLMSIWFWLIFGIMMGDIGYGLILLIGAFVFLKVKKPKGSTRSMFVVFGLSGITSIVAGIAFDSFFGYDILNRMGLNIALTNPIEQPIQLLIFSLLIGVLHIISGLIMKIVLSLKRKDVLSALADGFSWIFVLSGLLFAFWKPVLEILGVTVGYQGQGVQILAIIGYVFLIIGALLILILSGREQKNIFKKVTSGLGGIYGITGYLSDILSYSRILALSLSTAVIAFAMNTLAEMVSGGFGWIFAIIIYIIGHVFNFAMGLLSAYVHDSRLQYIEFYGKFYEGNGYLFDPFVLQIKHVNEVTNKDL